nr:DUF1330 domain-containing protein [Haliscomenobacter sp.]
MPAYVIVQVKVNEPVEYELYKSLTPASIHAFGGRFIVRGAAVETLEGSWNPGRLVVVEFPDKAIAQAWWESEEYAPAKAIRQRTAETEMILVEGFVGLGVRSSGIPGLVIARCCGSALL